MGVHSSSSFSPSQAPWGRREKHQQKQEYHGVAKKVRKCGRGRTSSPPPPPCPLQVPKKKWKTAWHIYNFWNLQLRHDLTCPYHTEKGKFFHSGLGPWEDISGYVLFPVYTLTHNLLTEGRTVSCKIIPTNCFLKIQEVKEKTIKQNNKNCLTF